MEKINKYIFVILLFPFVFLAQGPGYIGKKFITGYGFEVSPIITAPTNVIPVNFTQQLYFESAFNTNTSFGCTIKNCFTRYDNSLEMEKFGNPSSYYTIRAFSFSPYLKLFSGKYVAPWGKYWLFGPVLNIISTKHDGYMNLTQRLSDHDTLLFDFGSSKQTFYKVDFLIGKGRSRVFNKKIVVDYGFNFQLIALIYGLIEKDFSSLSQQNYIRLTAIDRMRGVNRFNLFLKVGYLF